jgi:hypothetical protein
MIGNPRENIGRLGLGINDAEAAGLDEGIGDGGERQPRSGCGTQSSPMSRRARASRAAALTIRRQAPPCKQSQGLHRLAPIGMAPMRLTLVRPDGSRQPSIPQSSMAPMPTQDAHPLATGDQTAPCQHLPRIACGATFRMMFRKHCAAGQAYRAGRERKGVGQDLQPLIVASTLTSLSTGMPRPSPSTAAERAQPPCPKPVEHWQDKSGLVGSIAVRPIFNIESPCCPFPATFGRGVPVFVCPCRSSTDTGHAGNSIA